MAGLERGQGGGHRPRNVPGPGLAGGAGLLRAVHGGDLDLPDRVPFQRGGRHRPAVADVACGAEHRLHQRVAGGQPDGAVAASQQYSAADRRYGTNHRS